MYRRDHETSEFNCHKRTGMGVLVAVSNEMTSCRRVEWENGCEDIWVTIETHSNIFLQIYAFYLTPPLSNEVPGHVFLEL